MIRKVQRVLPKYICDFWQSIEIAAMPMTGKPFFRSSALDGKHVRVAEKLPIARR